MNSKVQTVLLFTLVTAVKTNFIPSNQVYQTVSVALPTVSEGDLHEADLHPQYKYVDIVGNNSQNKEHNADGFYEEYQFIDADGNKRSIKYISDGHGGINAVVELVPLVKINGSFQAFESEFLESPTAPESAVPLAHVPSPITPLENTTKPVAPVSEYTNRHTSYDVPIYLKSALGNIK